MSRLSHLTRNEIAELLQVHPATISKYRKKGFPVNSDKKTYPGPACVSWSLEQIAETATKDAAETDESKKWLARLREERFLKAKLERQEKENSLIARDSIRPFVGAIFAVFRQGLLDLKSRLPALLEGKSQVEMGPAIFDEACLVLDGLTKAERRCSFKLLPAEYQELHNQFEKAMEVLR